MKLSSCQEEALEVLESGANVFLTGQAGTGKSTVLKTWLSKKRESDYAVTASTGIAAMLVGGRTVHSLFRIGTGERSLASLLEERSPYARRTLQSIKILIIDEVSMISADLFEKLERIAAHDRHDRDTPWGGLQVVVVGDMAQLPPVNGEWAFSSPAWKRSRFVPVVLQTQLRTTDVEFAGVLRRIGRGELDEEVCAFLDARVATTQPPYNWVRLMGKRSGVDIWNHARLSEITSRPVYLNAEKYCAQGMEWMLEKIAESMPVPVSIAVAEGAYVMFRKNMPEAGIANGTTGYIEKIDLKHGVLQIRISDLNGNPGPRVVTLERTQYAFPEPDRRPPRAAIHQFSIQLAWAMTIHKCIAPSTLIECNGGLMPAGEAPEEMLIGSEGAELRAQAKVVNPTAPALRVETKRGYTVTVTPDHGLVLGSGEMVEAESIQEGDVLLLDRGDPHKGWGSAHGGGRPLPPPRALIRPSVGKHVIFPTVMSDELAEWMGIIVADGTVYARGVRVAKRHPEMVARWASLTSGLFGVVPTTFVALNAVHAEVNRTSLATWLLRALDGFQPNNKNVPRCVLGASPSEQRSFLRGVFEDGSVHFKRDGLFSHLEWSSSSESLAKNVHILLLRVGVASTLKSVPKNGRPHWRVWIYGADADRFRETIGFISPKKVDKLSTKPASLSSGADRLVDTVVRVTRVWSDSVCWEVPGRHQFTQGGFVGSNCQGATLDRAVVNLGDLWDPGQAYVALSRVRSKEGLAITGWDPRSFLFDPSVATLYDVMERVHARRIAAKRAAGPSSVTGKEETVQDRALHVLGETLAQTGVSVADLRVSARVPAMDGLDGVSRHDGELEPVGGEGVGDTPT